MNKRRSHILIITIALITLIFIAREAVFFLSVGNAYQSKHFHIKNYSDASHWELRDLAQSLEKRRAQVYHFFQMKPTLNITVVTVKEGFRIPSANDGELQMYRWHGVINQSAIVHELGHIISDNVVQSAINEGLSVFVSESIHEDHLNRFPNYNQKSDAWVLLFLQNNSFVPLKDLLELPLRNFNISGSPEDAYSWQAYLEGASFVHWIIQTKGWDVFWKYAHLKSPIPFLGPSFEDIEKEWVGYIKKQQLPTFSCRQQLDQSEPRFQFWCDRAEGVVHH